MQLTALTLGITIMIEIGLYLLYMDREERSKMRRSR